MKHTRRINGVLSGALRDLPLVTVMTFSSFCLLQLSMLRAKLYALEQAMLRRRIPADQQAEKARWFAQIGATRW